MNLNETAGAQKAKRLREATQKTYERLNKSVMESIRKDTLRATQNRVDIFEDRWREALDFTTPGFSIKEFERRVVKACEAIREANDATVVQQLLRAGIQTSVNSEYQAVETNYQEWVHMITSDKAIELYAPLYRAGFLAPIEDMEEPPQMPISGMDIEIRNKEKALIIAISRNAIDDDQTSQLQEQANQAGANAAIEKDSYIYRRWISKGNLPDAAGYNVPSSQTGSQAGETTWPWNTAFTLGGGQNRLATYAALSYQNIIALRLLARKMLDPKGQKMLVMPDTILCGVGVVDPIKEMVDSDSQFYPSTSTIKQTGTLTGGGAATADTGAGQIHSKNLLKGAYNVNSSIWLPDTAYAIGQAGKGFTLQQRRPLAVVQENPLSGTSFAVRAFRYRIDERYEADWREPRFWVLGSDGSI